MHAVRHTARSLVLLTTRLLSATLLLTATPLLADTVVPGGNVSGAWTAAGSPYLVQGSITVPAGATLTLEPGVVVFTSLDQEITVQGTLEAVGTEAAPIVFTGPTGAGWGGLRITGADAAAVLEHCTVEHGDRQGAFDEGGGVACYDGAVTLRACSIIDNTSYLDGAGVYAINAQVVIEDCEIARNLIDGANSAAGGGVYAENCQVEIRGSRIHHNRVETFTFFGATNSHGGGVALELSGGVVEDCLIDGNYVTHSGTATASLGGGLYAYAHFQKTLLLRGNTVAGNQVNYNNAHGGGIYLVGYSVELSDNLITGNIGHGLWCDGGIETAVIHHNDVWGNSAGAYGGAFVPTGVGQITQANVNGDPCDAFFNIAENPLYTAPSQGDYTLMPGSPAIDAGDPASPVDPDGTVADLGAFYHHQAAAAVRTTTHGTRLSMLRGAQPAPMTSRTTITYRLPRDGRVRLGIYDLRGSEVRTLVDGVQPAGERSVAFDGRDESGRDLPAGTYLYRLQADGRFETRKIAVLR